MIHYMLNGNTVKIRVIVGLIKDISLYKISYFLEAYSYNEIKIKAKFDLYNYATKSDLKEETDIRTSQFAKKIDLGNLKAEVDLSKICSKKWCC